MVGFIDTTCNHNQLQQPTICDRLRLAPFWLDRDCLPFYCDWFGSESLMVYEWISNAEWRLIYEWIADHVSPLYNF
jgi:hypothetical protein